MRRSWVSLEASLYSVPPRRVQAEQRVELRVTPDFVAVHALAADGVVDGSAPGELLAVHPRAAFPGSSRRMVSNRVS